MFIHIPKCGGTSFHRALGRLFDGQYLHLSPLKAKWPESIDFDGLRGGGGHQPFGHSPLEVTDRPIRYISVMRDPLDRFISFYRHVQTDGGHYLRQGYEGFSDVRPLPFAHRLLEVDILESRNTQCAFLSEGGATTCKAALSNIDTHEIEVIPSRFLDLFIYDLYEDAGKKYARSWSNISAHNLEMSVIEQKELTRLIYRMNREDLNLYKTIESRYVDRLISNTSEN